MLALLRRLREQKGGAGPTPTLGGLAGAATLLTRLPSPMVMKMSSWADTLSLKLFATVFSGANPGLRVVRDVRSERRGDRWAPPSNRLKQMPGTRYVARRRCR